MKVISARTENKGLYSRNTASDICKIANAWIEVFGDSASILKMFDEMRQSDATLYEGETLESLKAKFTGDEDQNWDYFTQTSYGVLYAN